MSEPGAPRDPWQPPYPPWQQPPRRVSPVVVVLVTGSIVVALVMVAAFLAYGYPGFLRPAPDKADAPPAPWTGSVTLASPTPTTTNVRIPGQRTPTAKRSKPLPDPQNCVYLPDKVASAPKPATPPPDGPQPSNGQVAVMFETSAGPIDLTLDRALAPCTVANFLSLAKQNFYTGTSCHRLAVGDGLQMLQCGDPKGDGTGGPGYTIPDETFPELSYGRGVLAMARTSEPNSGGSQFFMVFGDANIPADYTVFGTIGDAGLATIDKVARGGVDQSDQQPDGTGRPNVPVSFTRVDVH